MALRQTVPRQIIWWRSYGAMSHRSSREWGRRGGPATATCYGEGRNTNKESVVSSSKPLAGRSGSWTRPLSTIVDYSQDQQHYNKPRELLKGDYVPVFAALGMIVVSVSFGLHTAKQQLKHCPGVWVRKDKRETLPEVVEPDLVEDKAQSFINRSFFRKVAHIQDSSLHNAVPNPIRGDPFVSKPRVESLKSIGIDPKHS